MDLIEKLKPCSELSESLESIKRWCLKVWENPLLPWFTNHDVKHSEEIIHLLGQILEPIEESNIFLNEHELFILLASAYLHDIGMQYLKVDNKAIENLTQDEYNKIRKNHAAESYEIILTNIEKKVLRDNFHPPIIDEEYLPIIASVSKGHASDYFDEIITTFYEVPAFAKNRKIRGPLLTSLLMIGDELDMQFKRVDFSKLSQFTLSAFSQVHWYKHHYVEFIEVKNAKIHLSLKFPKNADAYQMLFQEWIETKLKEQIAKVNPAFEECTKGKLYLVEDLQTTVRTDETPLRRPLPDNALEELIRVVKKDARSIVTLEDSKKSISSLPKPRSIFTGRKKELARFKEALDTANIISIEGLGGIGKTEFAAKCIEDFIPEEKVVWVDCVRDTKLDALIDLAGFSDVLKGENKTELAKCSGFTDLIERDEKCIFLDNYQEVTDSAFGKFFQFSERRLQKAKIILIAREHPAIGSVRILPVTLSGLENDSLEYAKRIIEPFHHDIDVSDNDLENICDKVDGHPLAIDFAIQLLHYGESPQNIIPKIVSSKGKNEKLSHRLLDEIFNHPKSTEEEKRFILKFSALRGKVDKKAIHSLFGDDDSTLYTLMDKHMITHAEGLYATHPLIREFCYLRLEHKKEIHSEISEYLKTKRQERFDPLLEEEIFYHLLHSEHFQELADLISEKGEEFILSGHTNSLKEKIDIIRSKGMEKPELFIFYGDIAQISGNWKNASHYFERAFSFPGVDEKISAEAFIKYGEMLYRKGEVKKTLSYFQDAYNTCQKIHYQKGQARSINDIGLMYKTFGNLSDAEEKINEALGIYQNIKDKVGIATSLSNIGLVLHNKGDLKGALDKYQESLNIQQEIGNKSGIASSLNNIGSVFHYKGDLKGALDKYQESLNIQQEIGDKSGFAVSLNNIGSVLHDKGDFKGALDKYQKSLNIQQEIGDKSGIANSLYNIGNVFYEKRDLKGALDKYQKSLNIRQEIGDKSGIASSLNNIGIVFRVKGNLKGALDKHQESLNIRQEIGDKSGIASSLNSIGNVLHNKGDLKGALDKYQESLHIKQEIGDKAGIATSLNNIGSVLHDKDDFKGTLNKYQESLNIQQEIGSKKDISTTHYNLGMLYKKEKSYVLSLQHLFLAYALENQIGIKKQKTLNDINSIRKTLGLARFKEIAKGCFDSLHEELKPYLNLQEFTVDKTVRYESKRPGRNDPCPCGSGKKYKKCCGK